MKHERLTNTLSGGRLQAMAIMVALLVTLSAPCLRAQGLAPAVLLHPNPHTWPTYNGDYSGRRFSPLTQINRRNAGLLTLAWAFQSRVPDIKATPLLVHGVLYFTAPDNVWAIDAFTGQQIWHYLRPSQGDHIASRGVAMYHNRLFFGTPDAHLICLDARNGKVLWNKVIADVSFGYYIAVAPLIVHGKVIIGTSGDTADVPHFLEALDPKTGDVLWRFHSIPQPGQPGSETWPDARAMAHGGGPMWLTGTYDPKLNLLYWGTGNPHPVLDGRGRTGDDLYTCSIVALNPDTGKLVWAFQPSPHDTHDWDAVETPVLFTGVIHGKRIPLLAQASRNGYFFVLDRRTGKDLVTRNFDGSKWAKGIDARGEPIPNPKKMPQPNGTLIRSYQNGGTNWMPPSFDPQTGLFYFTAERGASLWYLNLDASGQAVGHQGGSTNNFDVTTTSLEALNYKTGKPAWQRPAGRGTGTMGVLSTAGHLVFTGDLGGSFLALDAATGKVLWHARGGANLSNGPITYELDGRQYVVMAAAGVLYAFTLPAGHH